MTFRAKQIPGVLGLVLTIATLLFVPVAVQPWYFFVGALLMGLTAVLEWHIFYMGLEVIVITGTVLGCLALDSSASIVILAVVSVAVFVWFWRRKLIHDRVDLFGFIGMCVLAYAYAVISLAGFLISGVLLSVYSFLDLRRGSPIALLWLILNACFAVVGAYVCYTSWI